MKKETKYTLVSIPLVYASLSILSLLLSLRPYISFGACGEYLHKCNIIEFLTQGLIYGFVFSVYFFPVYVAIPLITFFTIRHFRIKHQVILTTQPDTTTQKSRQGVGNIITKIITRAIIIVLVFFALYYWAYFSGINITRIIPEIISELFQFETKSKNVADSVPKNIKPIPPIDEWILYKSNYGYEIKYPPNYKLVYDGYEGPDSASLEGAVFSVKEYDPRLRNFVVEYFNDRSKYEDYEKNYEATYFRHLPYHEIFKSNAGHYYLVSFPDRIEGSISPEEQMIVNSFKLTDLNLLKNQNN
jgi:hypothetical protein